MSAVILEFPKSNRPAPLNPPQDVVTKVRAYCWKVGLNNFDRHTVMRAVRRWQVELNLDDRTVAARGMAMANGLALSHKPPQDDIA